MAKEDYKCRFGKVLVEIIVQARGRDISQTTGWINLELSRKKRKQNPASSRIITELIRTFYVKLL